MNCDGCDKPNKHFHGAMVGGKFGQFCTSCINKVKRQDHPGIAQYNRDRDREAHAADLVQPWDGNGKPNKEFIRLYPEEAKGNFSKEELENYG